MKSLFVAAILFVLLVHAQQQTAGLGAEGARKTPKPSIGQQDFAVTPDAKQLVPLFINWALKRAPIPGQPTEKDAKRLKLTSQEIRKYQFPDTGWVLGVLKEHSSKLIYISWNADGQYEENRFQWKYELSTGDLKPLSRGDCDLLDKRWRSRTLTDALTVAEQGSFSVKKTKEGKTQVSFGIGWGAGEFELQKTRDAWVLTKKPRMWVY